MNAQQPAKTGRPFEFAPLLRRGFGAGSLVSSSITSAFDVRRSAFGVTPSFISTPLAVSLPIVTRAHTVSTLNEGCRIPLEVGVIVLLGEKRITKGTGFLDQENLTNAYSLLMISEYDNRATDGQAPGKMVHAKTQRPKDEKEALLTFGSPGLGVRKRAAGMNLENTKTGNRRLRQSRGVF